MIYKRCPSCGRRIEEGKICEPCARKRRRTGNRTDGIRHEYKTARWQKAREQCLQTFDFIDLYALYHDGCILSADRVHHIYEILDYPERFYLPDNHIPVSDWSHQEIHRRYRDEDPETVRQELIRYRKKWLASVR